MAEADKSTRTSYRQCGVLDGEYDVLLIRGDHRFRQVELEIQDLGILDNLVTILEDLGAETLVRRCRQRLQTQLADSELDYIRVRRPTARDMSIKLSKSDPAPECGGELFLGIKSGP